MTSYGLKDKASIEITIPSCREIINELLHDHLKTGFVHFLH